MQMQTKMARSRLCQNEIYKEASLLSACCILTSEFNVRGIKVEDESRMLRFPRHRPRLAELEPPGLERPKALRVAGQIELGEHAHAARGRVRHLSSLVLLFFCLV